MHPGLMMDAPLLISSLIVHADKFHGDTEIVTRTVEGPIHRYTYRDAHKRSRQLAKVLYKLGIKSGDRVGTLAWNTARHFEVYYATSGIGAICHTINPRLFPEQIEYIINHAEDKVLFFDITFAPIVAAIAAKCKHIKHFIALTQEYGAPEMAIPNLQFYEHLVRAEDDDLVWPSFDERTASSLCYTSGTTGNPKGVLYSHRSTLLHAYGSALPDSLSLSSNDCVLPVVPMFHVNAWGIPYAAPMTGAKLVFPGAKLDGASLSELYEAEGVTATSGVPTVWLGLLNHWKANDIKPRSLKKVVIGGSAAPKAMIEAFEKEYGCHVLHAWGMTELSPLGTVNAPKFKHQNFTVDEKIALQSKQGRPVFGIDLRIVNDEGQVLPHDGKAFGELQVRGAWVCSQYFQREPGAEHTIDGWFSTGDVVTIDPDGYMQITDRSKDVIKSGGEWISSIDLENVMMAHPAVAEAAVIGVKHPKWDERPLLIIVKKPGAELSKQEALDFYEGKVAKWWLPNDVAFVNELPHTATGKIQKLKLREQFKDFQFAE